MNEEEGRGEVRRARRREGERERGEESRGVKRGEKIEF